MLHPAAQHLVLAALRRGRLPQLQELHPDAGDHDAGPLRPRRLVRRHLDEHCMAALFIQILQAFGGDDELRRTPRGSRPLPSEQAASSLTGRVANALEAMESPRRSRWSRWRPTWTTTAGRGTSTGRRDGGGGDGGGPGEDADGEDGATGAAARVDG